jgi:predicted nucleic acid-binding protein
MNGMAVKVIDASALAASIFLETEADRIDGWTAGAELAAPALIGFEMANACRTKLRRNPDERDVLLTQFLSYIAMSIGIHEVDLLATLSLAEQFNLTAYDASYLWLAQHLNAELVTLDRQLARAAAALGQA